LKESGGLMQIKVEKPTEQYLQARNVRSWGIWEKEVSRFYWQYDETIVCDNGADFAPEFLYDKMEVLA
jgi:hypothetical protein